MYKILTSIRSVLSVSMLSWSWSNKLSCVAVGLVGPSLTLVFADSVKTIQYIIHMLALLIENNSLDHGNVNN